MSSYRNGPSFHHVLQKFSCHPVVTHHHVFTRHHIIACPRVKTRRQVVIAWARPRPCKYCDPSHLSRIHPPTDVAKISIFPRRVPGRGKNCQTSNRTKKYFRAPFRGAGISVFDSFEMPPCRQILFCHHIKSCANTRTQYATSVFHQVSTYHPTSLHHNTPLAKRSHHLKSSGHHTPPC